MFCTKCGKQIHESSRFCTFCGTVVRQGLAVMGNSKEPDMQHFGLHVPVDTDAPDAPKQGPAPGSAEAAKVLFFADLYVNALEYLREGPRQNTCHDLVLHLCAVTRELLQKVPKGPSYMPGQGDALLFEPLVYITLAALALRDLRTFDDPEYEVRKGELLGAWREALRLARTLDPTDFSADPDAPPPF